MIKYALNNCLVKIKRRFQDSTGKIKIDTSWHPEEYATMEGIVYSAPLKVQQNESRRVMKMVKEGDRVFFSYSVVFGYTLQAENQSPVYKNLVVINGEEYWKVDMCDLFFNITENDEIEMVTDHVLLSMFPVEHSVKNTSGLLINQKVPEHLGIVKALPNNKNLSVRVGDTVCFEPRFVQKYNILGQEHMIIQTHRLLAKA